MTAGKAPEDARRPWPVFALLTACIAIGAGTLVLTGVGWLWGQMERLDSDSRLYYQSSMAVLVIAVFGGLLFWLLNKANIVDFMIATEAEMKKVNWPSKKQVVNLTWVVICGTILVATLLFVIDVAFGYLFLKVRVLESSAE